MKHWSLASKVALVTGASSGIGEATSVALAARGAKVALVARRADRLEEIVRTISARGGTAVALASDITCASDVKSLPRRVHEALGPIDLLVNNAGRGMYGTFASLRERDLLEVFGLNVFAQVAITQAFLPDLEEKKGRIVFVSSVVAHRSMPGSGAYCASKAALHALAESLRVELGPRGVRVILVSPGLASTEFRQAASTADGQKLPPVHRLAMSKERVAEALVLAVVRGQREVLLTPSGKAMVLINRLSAGLVDRIAAVAAKRPPQA